MICPRASSMLGDGMLSFGTAVAIDFRNAKSSPKIARSSWSRSTTLGTRISLRTSPVSLRNGRNCVPAAVTPPIRHKKSMCQLPRRSSPSVTHRSPNSSCLLTTWRMALSSTRRRSSAEMRLLSNCLRASSTACGRRRLPTWSARKGAWRAETWLTLENAVLRHGRSVVGNSAARCRSSA